MIIFQHSVWCHMVTEKVGRTNAWYAAPVIYGYWLPAENDCFFHKKNLIILKSTCSQRKFILIKLPVKYSSKLIIYKNSRGRCFSKHLSRSVLLTLIRKFAWNNNEQLFLMVLFIVYYIYKPCIIAPNQVTCILAKIILLGIFYVYQ